MRRALSLFALGALVFAQVARAEELPVLLQIQLLSKMSTYLETLVTDGSTVKVLVVFPGPADSPTRGAQDLLSALSQVSQFGSLKVQAKAVPFDGKKFQALLDVERPGILYLAPEVDVKVTAAVIEACAERPTVTISGNADSVKLGVVLGFSLVEARPRVLINLKQAGRQKITFRPGLVSHSVVVDR